MIKTDAFHGMQIRITDYPQLRQEQVRFPRSKRKRIRKKWAADTRNFKTVEDILVLGGVAVMSREMFCKIQLAAGASP